MKKCLSLIIVLSLCLCFLVSCQEGFDAMFKAVHKEKQLHEHTFDYIAYDTGHFQQYTCGCPSPELMQMHFDENGDGICDACNYIMVEHKHIFGEWQYDAEYHWCTAECTLEMCDIDTVAEHYDDDGDLHCDVCGYEMSIPVWDVEWHYTETCHWYLLPGEESDGIIAGYGEHVFEDGCDICTICGYYPIHIAPPENHFLRNLSGCEWLCEVSNDDIVEIKIIDEAVGVAPGTFKYIRTTRDPDVISKIFEKYYWLDTTPISAEEGQIDGGGAITVRFTLIDGTVKELFFNNGNYLADNGYYFELSYTPNFEDSDNFVKSYGFITYQGQGTVKDAEGNIICSILLDELEFVEMVDDIEIGDNPVTHYADTEFGKLYFLSEVYFYVEGIVEGDPWIGVTPRYFQLYGKNLDELITEYSNGN